MGKKEKNKWHLFESLTTGNHRHVRISKTMYDHQAWKALTSYERDLYLHIKMKYNGRNNDNISFTYKEGQELMSRSRFIKARDRLVELGFIDIIENWRHSNRPTIYGLSARWRHYGTRLFEEVERPKTEGCKDGLFYGNQHTTKK